MDNRAIGVFDSGLGGLTAVKELERSLKNESIVYFGDTGRVPYGTRSRETITKYALQDISFLLSHNVKMIIAACGTVSSVMPAEISGRFVFPYSGVITPACRAAVKATKNKKIGVLGTSATVNSGKPQEEILKLMPDASVTPIACPLFVSLVENGFTDPDNKVTALVAEQYLEPLIKRGVDTIILGCTHFPIIKSIIGRIVGDEITLIDTGKETARAAAEILKSRDMLSGAADHERTTCYFVSDSADNFERLASVFLKKSDGLHAEKIDIEAFGTQINADLFTQTEKNK